MRAADIVPAARTVLFDEVDDVDALVASLPAWRTSGTSSTGDLVEVPTTYDGEDLDDVARLWDMTRDEVVTTHTGTELVVAFCGFAPGFPYCTGLPERLAVPRLDSPRTRVPAGAVGLAGPFTGVYPTASPGGWRLIGRTDLVAVGPGPGPAGDAGPRDAGEVRGHVRTLTVVDAGPLTTVQDRGRPGWAHLGVPARRCPGPARGRPGEPAGRATTPSAAVLETTLGGVAFDVRAGRRWSRSRAPSARSRVGDRAVAFAEPVLAPAGAPVLVGRATRGVRSYVAVGRRRRPSPPVLGSRSTDTLAHVGPAVLRGG